MGKCKALEEYIRDNLPFNIKVDGREEILTVLRILQDKTNLRWCKGEMPLEFMPPEGDCRRIVITSRILTREVSVFYGESPKGITLTQFLSLVEELCPEERKPSYLEEYLKERAPVRIYYNTLEEARQILQALQEHTSFCWASGHKPLAWFKEKGEVFPEKSNICIEKNDGCCYIVHNLFGGYGISFEDFMDLVAIFSSSASKNKSSEFQQEYNRVVSLMLSNFL